MNKQEKQLSVNNRAGIHGRIATQMIRIINTYDVSLYIKYEGQDVECSSVLDILGVALVHGATFTIRLTGKETEKAMRAVEKLLEGTENADGTQEG